jgi:hypothetical protein
VDRWGYIMARGDWRSGESDLVPTRTLRARISVSSPMHKPGSVRGLSASATGSAFLGGVGTAFHPARAAFMNTIQVVVQSMTVGREGCSVETVPERDIPTQPGGPTRLRTGEIPPPSRQIPAQ